MTNQNQVNQQPIYSVTISTTHQDPVLVSDVVKYNFANGVAFLQDTDGDIFIYPMHTIKDIWMSEQIVELQKAEGVDTDSSL